MRTRRPEAPGRDRFGMAGARFRATRWGERSAPASSLGAHVDLDRGERRVDAGAGAGRRGLAARRLAGGGGRGAGPARRTAAHRPERGAARAAPPAAGPGPGRRRRRCAVEPAAIEGSVQMAAAALERLEREINGEALGDGVGRRCSARPLLDSAVAALARSRGPRRRLAGAALAGGRGSDRQAIAASVAQALDNLIVNAIEHGGPEIVVEARAACGRLRVVGGRLGSWRRCSRSRREGRGRADRPALGPAPPRPRAARGPARRRPPTAARFRLHFRSGGPKRFSSCRCSSDRRAVA